MIQNLAHMPFLYRFMAGGTFAIGAISIVGRIIGWKIASILMVGLILASIVIFLHNKGLKLRRRKKASAFDKGLQADANKPGKGKAEQRKAMGELSQRWNQAVGQLKASGLSLYDLPWYMLIGEPQSGKSTTLKFSGLEFPVGTDALSGAGGTRNCDWWFTNEAIILDTAGRFTFQEKNAPDSEEWTGFLKLLKKYRPACPINGVVLTIPCTSLLGDSPEEREAKAQNIREKLTQIQRELEVQFPVFILITKSDMILGFTEFFSRLGATEQRQLLGWSMHGPFIQAYDPDKFDSVFQQIYDRVHKWRNKILGEDLSLTEIDKLYVFPEEFKSIREPLNDYLRTIFVKTHYLPPLFFRGFYFTSGMQTGRPIAKACAAMLRSAGEGADEIIEHLQKIFERSRAFFIRDFYVEKLFPERNMVIHSEKRLKTGRKLAIAAIWGSVAVILLTLGLCGWSLWNMRGGVGDVEKHARTIKARFISQKDSPIDAIGTLSQYSESAEETEARFPGLHRDLRDIYWLYFMRNIQLANADRLYQSLRATVPGVTIKNPEDPATRLAVAKYTGYTRNWSINDDWINHATSSSKPYRHSADLGMTALFDEQGNLLQDQELTEKYKQHLERVRAIVGAGDEEIDFSDMPIAIPLVSGEANPRTNEVISKEIQYVKEVAADVPTQETVNNVVDAAKAFLQGYPDSIAGLLGDVGCDLNSVPFAAMADSINRLKTGFGEIDAILAANRDDQGEMPEASFDYSQAFAQLAWASAAIADTERTAQLNALINEAKQQLSAEMEQQLAANRDQLATVSNFITSGFTLSEGAALLRQGLPLIEALIAAKDEMLARAADASPDSVEAANVVHAEWLANAARAAAMGWAAAAKTGTADPWRLPEIGARVEQSILAIDEAVLTQAMVAYFRRAVPGTLLSSGQISGASLTSSPPSGAQPSPVAKANDEIAKLVAAIDDFKGKLTCDANKVRLNSLRESAQGVADANISNFNRYWVNAYNNWDPEAWIRSIPTWAAFKSDPLMQPGNLAGRVREDIASLIANVGGFSDQVGKVSSELNQIYIQLSGASAQLEPKINTFTDTVGGMSVDEMQALMQLNQQATSDRLGQIASNSKFDYYPQKVRELLGGAGNLDEKWDTFIAKWRGKLAGKFPFKIASGSVSRSDGQVVIPQAEATDFQAFFHGPDSLPAFIKEYQEVWDEWIARPQNASKKRFADQALALGGFFFDGDDYRLVSINGTYQTFEGALEADLAQISESIILAVPTLAATPEEFRWRTLMKGQSGDFTWRPGNYGNAFTFRSELDRSEDANKAEMRVPGDFSVLAYIVTQSPGAEAERRRWPVQFSVKPEGIRRDQLYNINFLFVLDRSMPALPDWDDLK
ncbi:MAG TPA: type VI secretion protein IcmF/TssM N-terminal domain-containing protein [Candidatus Sumerlaeota bacterium]|nr:type VI secretion protein IcmF/TssM N-terminal domain-containing protein [Candidatus Sumerlaeota bacterium]HPK01596.1 type VI secretion protein IcmF/TssM N-terminal domain-containing protein [Candidatus Sumerlaeota bacterium]